MAKPTLVAAVSDVAAGHGGVDADDPPGGVDERAAGVPRRDRRVGLDQPVERPAVLGDDRAVDGRHDPERHRRLAVEVEGEPDRQHLVTQPDFGGRGERDRREVVGVDAQQGEVVAGVGCHELGLRRFGLAGEADADLGRPLDDVGVGQDLAVGGDDDAGADRAAVLQIGADRHDRRAHRFGDSPHREPRSGARPARAATARRLPHPAWSSSIASPIRTPATTATNAAAPAAMTVGHTRRCGAPGRLGGLGGTPGAGGGSTDMRTVYRLAGTTPRHAEDAQPVV